MVLLIGRGKIEHETKREKNYFHLGGTQEKGESKVLPPLRRYKKSLCKSKERGRREREREREREPLREKKDSQERAVGGEENKRKLVCV